MKLVVVSSAPIVIKDKKYMYAPYQKEMKVWAKHADEIQFCCPIWEKDRGLLVDEISFSISNTIALKEFDVKSITKIPLACYYSILNFWMILKTIKSADHVHLRCPGNMALLACIAQIFYPKKTKTAKYAGNWDPKSKQPWSYRLQKWILSNTILTKNMQVLVYGEWPNQTKNIKPFFTATYSDSDKKEIKLRSLTDKIRFLFVGMLSEGKQPLYAAQLIKALIVKGYTVQLDYYGDGKMHNEIEKFIIDEDLKGKIIIQGNQSKETLEKAYQESNFLVLPSKSEGWPKVVAEAMFWGCVPIVTPVSCVPYMLDYGNRGIVLQMNLEYDTKQIEKVLQDTSCYTKMALNGMEWSREFTTDKFEKEIKKLLSI